MTDLHPGDQRARRRGESETWARHALDIASESGEDVVRHAILARLAESQFVPPPIWDEAANLLADPTMELRFDDEAGYRFFHGMEMALQEQVTAFSNRYFDLPPAQRREQWMQLAEAAEFSPRLHEHLQRLAVGLDVEVGRESVRNPQVQELIDHIAATFALPAPLRAAAELALLDRVGLQSYAWREAVKQLHKQAPQVGSLAGIFSAEIERRALMSSVYPSQKAAGRPWTKVPLHMVGLAIAVCVMPLFHLILDTGASSPQTTPTYHAPPSLYVPLPTRPAAPPYTPPPSPSVRETQSVSSERGIPVVIENGRASLRTKGPSGSSGARLLPPLELRPQSPSTPADNQPHSPSTYRPFSAPTPSGGPQPWRP